MAYTITQNFNPIQQALTSENAKFAQLKQDQTKEKQALNSLISSQMKPSLPPEAVQVLSDVIKKRKKKELATQAEEMVDTVGVGQAEQLLVQESQAAQQAPDTLQTAEPEQSITPDDPEFTEIQSAANDIIGSLSNRPKSVVNKLFQAIGFGESADNILKKVTALQGAQEILGQKPLQQGEREKLDKTLRNELAKIAQKPTDAMTPKEAADFNLLLDGANSTVNISNMLDTNVTKQLFAQGVPNFLKSQGAKLLQSNIERAVQAKTRIETGAALAPKELVSTAKRFMPQKGDTLKTALERLKPLNDFFQGAINAADPSGVHRQRIGGTQQDGLLQKIQQEKQRRGLQ